MIDDQRVDTHGYRLTFGRYSGERLTRVPVAYLRWMVNRQTQEWEYAQAEIERRGSTLPDMEISPHAVDRASLRLWESYLAKRKRHEGLHSWLLRTAGAALRLGSHKGNKIIYKGISFIFETEGETQWPVLKTIMLTSNGRKVRKG